jgi:hypothetical protein
VQKNNQVMPEESRNYRLEIPMNPALLLTHMNQKLFDLEMNCGWERRSF